MTQSKRTPRRCACGCGQTMPSGGAYRWGHWPDTTAARFREHVEKTDGCWLWTGARNSRGYGYIKQSRTRRNVFAHRYSWELVNGPIPNGLYACHRCDNPPCVNPDHLFLGTNADNLADMVAKGRHGTWDRRGERNPSAKLNAEKVRAIRRRLADGVPQGILAAEYGVSAGAIYFIQSGHTWRSVATK